MGEVFRRRAVSGSTGRFAAAFETGRVTAGLHANRGAVAKNNNTNAETYGGPQTPADHGSLAQPPMSGNGLCSTDSTAANLVEPDTVPHGRRVSRKRPEGLAMKRPAVPRPRCSDRSRRVHDANFPPHGQAPFSGVPGRPTARFAARKPAAIRNGQRLVGVPGPPCASLPA